MSERLLTEAELVLIETYQKTVNFPENTARLIADHRRMREAIRKNGHDQSTEDGWCLWSGCLRPVEQCTPDNCIFMECQP